MEDLLTVNYIHTGPTPGIRGENNVENTLKSGGLYKAHS